jgi:adenosine deaminase
MQSIPKAELHVHIDGTITPALALEMAAEKKIQLPDRIFNEDKTRFVWTDFSTDFHCVFEAVLQAVQSSQDFYRITYAYLKQLAEQNTVYCELIVPPIHEGLPNLTYYEILTGVVDAILQAEKDFGIVARIIPIIMRHYGPRVGEKTMAMILHERHPYVVGVNLVGDIVQHEVKAFADLFDKAHAAGLKVSCHAGECSGGPDEIWQAIEYCHADRISHGVRAIEDPKLLQIIVDQKIPLEVCPSSNVQLGMYPDFKSHPLKQLHDAGVVLSLNTDDPGFFATNLTREYQIAYEYAGFSESDLIKVTKTALASAFIDEKLVLTS